jgi:hypothetical protein
MVDFDFGESAAGQETAQTEPFGSMDFSAESSQTSEPEAPEKEEPETGLDLSAALKIPEAQTEPEPAAPPKAEVKKPVEAKPSVTPEIRPEIRAEEKPAIGVQPKPEPARTAPKPAEKAHPAAAPVPKPAKPGAETINPFASGAATGLAGGIGCAIPIAALLAFGLSVIVKFVPLLRDMPSLLLAAVAGAGIISVGIMVGVFVAAVQALARKKLFFLLNMLLGAIFGAVVGAAETAASSLLSSTGISAQQITGAAVNWGVGSFLISIPVVIARRIMVHAKEETFSKDLSAAQAVVLVTAVAIVGSSFYGQRLLVSKVGADMAARFSETVTTEGLAVANPYGYIDPQTGDLVVTGAVENTSDKGKTGWYLVADVNDQQGMKVVSARMVNGKQLYSGRDFEILAKRGFNAEQIKAAMLSDRETTIPAAGKVQFEIRFMEPPAGIASFYVTLQPFNPLKVFEEMAQEMQPR